MDCTWIRGGGGFSVVSHIFSFWAIEFTIDLGRGFFVLFLGAVNLHGCGPEREIEGKGYPLTQFLHYTLFVTSVIFEPALSTCWFIQHIYI